MKAYILKITTYQLYRLICCILCFFLGSIITSCSSSGDAGIQTSTSKAITAFLLDVTPGTITGTTIAVIMPFGTNVTGLIDTFTTTGESVSISGVTQTSGSTSAEAPPKWKLF